MLAECHPETRQAFQAMRGSIDDDLSPPDGPLSVDEPVPVIVTFGSPCQDVAVATNQGFRGWVGPRSVFVRAAILLLVKLAEVGFQ
eukprot:5068130-Lingulodinium_polyedra.AAC.1